MIKCEICNDREKVKVSQGVYCCDICIPPRLGSIGIKHTVILNGSYKTTRARINELDRRVVLNFNPKDHTYNVGRRSESGKIQEKNPHY